MNTTQFHTPSFGDFDVDVEKSQNPSNIGTGNMITTNNGAAAYMYQQQTTPQQQFSSQTKRMINLHNTSDEYHTANDDSFTPNTMSFSSSPSRAQQQGVAGTATTGSVPPPTTLAARKQIPPVDPNEPAKPLSAYALFFRDTVSAIKQQNPMCSFQELSKIVASMWEALDPVHKSVYNKKNELARNEYIKQMRIYRQQQPQTPLADGGVQTQAAANMATLQQQIPQTKPAVFTMNLSQQQQQSALPQNNQTQPQINQNPQPPVVNNIASTNNTAAAAPAIATSTSAPSDEPIQILSEDGAVQKCTRENCNKRAIINPDWEDEYCSNECVIVHCRNVFNAWVQSNLEAKQQQQPSEVQQQQTQATAT